MNDHPYWIVAKEVSFANASTGMIARGEARYHGHRHCAWHMGMGTGKETSRGRTSIGSDIGAGRGHGDKHGLGICVCRERTVLEYATRKISYFVPKQ